MNSIISEVGAISMKKKKWLLIHKKLEEIFDETENLLLNAKQEIKSINKIFKNLKNKDFKKHFKKLKKYDEKLKNLKELFEFHSRELTQQKQFLEEEFIFYQTCLRDSNEFYRDNLMGLKNIKKEIELFSLEIKKIENEYKNNLLNGNNDHAYILLKKYIKNVQKHVSVMSQVKSFEVIIYKTIPNNVEKLLTHYKKVNKELSNGLNHLNFQINMKNIVKVFKETQYEYSNLNFTKVSEKIKQIFKQIKVLENLINYEINCRNHFYENKDEIISEIKSSYKKYSNLKLKIKSLVGSGKKISINLKNTLKLSNDSFEKLKNSSQIFESKLRNKNSPYSSKLEGIKVLLLDSYNLVENINMALENLWYINIKNSILKNKFKQSESAFQELIINMKKYDLILTDKEKTQKNNIEKGLNKISKTIYKNNIDKDVNDKVDLIVEQITSFYKTINSNIQIVEMINNTIKHLGPLRAINLDVNVELQNVEKNYLSGRYTIALTQIISVLERGEI